MKRYIIHGRNNQPYNLRTLGAKPPITASSTMSLQSAMDLILDKIRARENTKAPGTLICVQPAPLGEMGEWQFTLPDEKAA